MREGQEEGKGEDDVETREQQDKRMTGGMGLLETRTMTMSRTWAATGTRSNTEGVNWDEVENNGVNWDEVENDGDDEYDSATTLSQRTRSRLGRS